MVVWLTGDIGKRLEFIVETAPHRPSGKNKRLIRSHVSRGRLRRKDASDFKSWILQKDGKLMAIGVDYNSIPSRVGSDLSLINFPEVLKPYMQEDIIRSLTVMKGALYPPEICLQVDPLQTSWSTSLLTDRVYLHSTLFSIEAYLDDYLGRPPSSLTQFHLLKTLRLLQERLAADTPESISDPTLMVVVVLGLTAELVGDRSAAENHITGLKGMIDLRGGLETLRFENSRLPAKVCRVDLGLALRFGCRPVFFDDSISWDEHISANGPTRAPETLQTSENSLSEFLETLDGRLFNVWKDLQEFSRLSNLAYQTSSKLPPNTFSEIMVSVLYRLMNLVFNESPVEDAVRLGMITFTAAMFFRWREMRQRQGYLDDAFRVALQKLEHTSTQGPYVVLLWLLMMWNICVPDRSGDGLFVDWLDDIILNSHFQSWMEARNVLKKIIWINYMHDAPGKMLFDAAVSRTKLHDSQTTSTSK
ncbi:Fc.00g115880.m01.CDS01 [Cosmosporella sp. VM-42]